ncbi:MAG: hypothetical protein ACO3A4_06015 [Silvanigrellaceae bacterium]
MDRIKLVSTLLLGLFVSACGVRYYPVQIDTAQPPSQPASSWSQADPNFDSLGNNMFRVPPGACSMVANIRDLLPMAQGFGYFQCRELDYASGSYFVAKIQCRRDICILVTPRTLE